MEVPQVPDNIEQLMEIWKKSRGPIEVDGEQLYLRRGEIIYVIDGGDMFEGTLDQFKDCFFPNATDRLIRSWCREQEYILEVRRERRKTNDQTS